MVRPPCGRIFVAAKAFPLGGRWRACAPDEGRMSGHCNNPTKLPLPFCRGRGIPRPYRTYRPPFIFSSYLFEVIHNVYRLSTLKLWKTRWKLWKTHPVFHRLHAARAKTRWKTPKFPVGNSALFDAKLLHSPRENVKIRYYQKCIINPKEDFPYGLGR